jgi:hypothetical protein
MTEHEVRANDEHSALVFADRRRIADTSEVGR